MDISLNNLSLCSGGGGLDLGLELALGGVRTVCWVEWEAFAIDYLATCMEASCLAAAPLWTDLRTFDGRPWRGVVDCVTAGYPCQPFSFAGRRRGTDDPRHLWPHVARILGECQPGIVFLENVPGHVSLGYEEVEARLQELDYDVTSGLFTAEEIGCTHRRERFFVLAVEHADRSEDRCDVEKRDSTDGTHVGRSSESPHAVVMGDSAGERLQERVLFGGDGDKKQSPVERAERPLFPPRPEQVQVWRDLLVRQPQLAPATESDIRDVSDGLAASYSQRLRLLGNGVVPLQAAYAFLSLWAVWRASREP